MTCQIMVMLPRDKSLYVLKVLLKLNFTVLLSNCLWISISCITFLADVDNLQLMHRRMVKYLQQQLLQALYCVFYISVLIPFTVPLYRYQTISTLTQTNTMLWVYFKKATARNMREFFSKLHCKNLKKLLKIKFTKVQATPKTGPIEFLSLRLFHNCLQQFINYSLGFLTPSTGFHGDFCISLSFQFGGQFSL